MSKKISRYFWHGSVWSLRLCMLFALLLLIFTGWFFWGIGQKPLDLGFAKEYIETALYDEETGNHISLDKVVLFWPDYKGPLYLQLEDAKILTPGGAVILNIDQAAMSFSRIGLLYGKILPKTIVIRSPSLRISRFEDGRFDFGFGDLTINDQSASDDDLLAKILSYIARPGEESAKKSIISKLEAFEIQNARLVVEDHVLGMSWFIPDFNAGFFSTRTGMSANFGIKLPDVGGEESRVNVNLSYDWDFKDLRLQSDIKNFDTMVLADKFDGAEILRNQNIILNSHVDARFDKSFNPLDLVFTLSSAQGTIFHPDVFNNPIAYKDLNLNARFDGATQKFTMQNTHLIFGNVGLDAGAELTLDKNQNIAGPVILKIDEVQQKDIAPLWPKLLQGDNSETWVVKRLSEGVFKNFVLGFDLSLAHNVETKQWDADARHLKASADFENMSLDYRAPMHPVTKAFGHGTFDLDTDEMDITLEKGFLGKMAIEKAKIVLDKLVAEGEGDCDILTSLKGTLPNVFKFLSEEPIHMNKKMKVDIAKTDGQAKLDVHLHFPAHAGVTLNDFKIDVNGTLEKVKLPELVGDLNFTGGPLDLNVKDGLVKASGKGELEGRDVDFAWEQFIDSVGKKYKSKVKAKMTADPNIRSRLGIDLSDFLEGSVPVDVDYTSYSDGRADIDVKADLTPALFFVDVFDFQKKPDEQGQAGMHVKMKNGVVESVSDLQASGKDFTLSKANLEFKNTKGKTSLSSGKFGAFTLGETKGNFEFSFDKNGAANLNMEAEFLDAQPFLSAKKKEGPYDAPPMVISATANKMRTAKDEVSTNAKFFIDIDHQGRFNQMEMDAKIGASNVYLRYKPDASGKRVFNLQTDDAGAFLKAFQVYNNIVGGKLVIYGEPVAGLYDRNLKGKAEIVDFKAVKAPVLTKLLSILSIPGLLEVLSSDGLNFTKLEADFEWLYRKEGSLLKLENGRTSGNSLGLTFDGTFDNAKRYINVEGTVIPMSEVNNFIGKIPLVGDILTGGSGSVFAATYSVKGESEKPQISVNPLSVLTPGILRRILFE